LREHAPVFVDRIIRIRNAPSRTDLDVSRRSLSLQA
jgi:hypothetical protein